MIEVLVSSHRQKMRELFLFIFLHFQKMVYAQQWVKNFFLKLKLTARTGSKPRTLCAHNGPRQKIPQRYARHHRNEKMVPTCFNGRCHCLYCWD